MEPRLELKTVREAGQPLRLIVAGEIDLSNAERFRAALAEATAGHTRVIVDLTDVEALGSAGIGALYRYADHVSVVFVTSGSVIGRALSIAGTNMLVAEHPFTPGTHRDNGQVDHSSHDDRPDSSPR